MFAKVGPPAPPICVGNSFKDRRSRMTLSKAPARSCPSSAPAEGAVDPGPSISRRRNCSRSWNQLFLRCFFVSFTHRTLKFTHCTHTKNCTPKQVSPKNKRLCGTRVCGTISPPPYIRTMEEPHFPVRCGPCRHHKKLRNNDPLSVNSQSAQQPGNTTAGLVIANNAWTEVVEFADGDDFQF